MAGQGPLLHTVPYLSPLIPCHLSTVGYLIKAYNAPPKQQKTTEKQQNRTVK